MQSAPQPDSTTAPQSRQATRSSASSHDDGSALRSLFLSARTAHRAHTDEKEESVRDEHHDAHSALAARQEGALQLEIIVSCDQVERARGVGRIRIERSDVDGRAVAIAQTRDGRIQRDNAITQNCKVDDAEAEHIRRNRCRCQAQLKSCTMLSARTRSEQASLQQGAIDSVAVSEKRSSLAVV
jgi:hypothetical protein